MMGGSGRNYTITLPVFWHDDLPSWLFLVTVAPLIYSKKTSLRPIQCSICRQRVFSLPLVLLRKTELASLVLIFLFHSQEYTHSKNMGWYVLGAEAVVKS